VNRYKSLIAYLLITLALGFIVLQLHSQQNALRANIANQVANRVTNVHYWCTAINQDRDAARLKPGSRFTPTNLNCAKLEYDTRKSASKN
jgi:hypothetical protein